MIAITSISPTHINKDVQHRAVETWQRLGMEVYSFNCPAEILTLKEAYPTVTFIPTHRTLELTYGKPLVSINAVLDWCKDHPDMHFCLINSDIEVNTDKDTIERIKAKMADTVVLANRVDYTITYDVGQPPYLPGIDIFFIHKNWLRFYPQSMHCFGMTFWDYFIPYVAIKSGIKVVFLEQKIAFHKAHKAQYSEDNWKKSGRVFLWEQNLYQFEDTRGIGAMSNFVYNFIYNASSRELI